MKKAKWLSVLLTTALLIGFMAFTANAEEAARNDDLVGRYIALGSYEQDNNPENGKESIEWLVLHVDEETGRALVLSRYALEYMPYHNGSGVDSSITWETSDLRAWLNREFLQAAFTAEELAKIPVTTVDMETDGLMQNALFGGKWGNSTQDQVFLLSVSEARGYLPAEEERKCRATAYATASAEAKLGRAIDIGTGYVEADQVNCWWWLRTPGEFDGSSTYIMPNGHVAGDAYRNMANYSKMLLNTAVRPAMWIQLSMIVE